jgi:hypothetical protein
LSTGTTTSEISFGLLSDSFNGVFSVLPHEKIIIVVRTGKIKRSDFIRSVLSLNQSLKLRIFTPWQKTFRTRKRWFISFLFYYQEKFYPQKGVNSQRGCYRGAQEEERHAVRGEKRRNEKMGRQGDGGLGDGFLLRAHTDLL